MDTNLTPLTSLLDKSLIFLARPGVQLQLFGILVALVVAWNLARGVNRHLRHFVLKLKLSNFLQVSCQSLVTVLEHVTFPIFSLLTILIIQAIIKLAGGWIGLLWTVLNLVWAWTLFEIFIGILYIVFPLQRVRRYHFRLLGPLFVCYALSQILGALTDLGPFINVVLVHLFGDPLTVGEILMATIGLYFWIDATIGLQDLLFISITKLTGADRGVVEASLTLLRYFIIVAGIVVICSALGFNPATVAAITGGLSVGVGFGLREILGNFISGILLLFEGSLKPGDVVDVGGEITVVRRLDIRSTTVRTLNNIEKVIPNQIFLTESFTTYTGTDDLVRLLIPIGASYKHDPELVIAALLETARQHPKVCQKPEPAVFLVGFGDSSVNFELAVWFNDPRLIKSITSDLNRMIWKTFAVQAIEIPFPQQDLHLKSGFYCPANQANANDLKPIKKMGS